MTDPDTKVTGTSTEIALKWLFGQPFNNVMLIAIFAGLAWSGHYCVTIAIPAHLQQIQQGYETIDKAHQIERSELRSMYDKWFDRVASGPSHAASMRELTDPTSANN